MEFVLDSRWSDSVDDKYIEDFLFVLGTTWNVGEKDRLAREFRLRYFENIYGPSLLTVIYADGKPAGCGAMWRNDIGKRIAYQRIDSCTLEAYRGKGLFRQAVSKELSMIGNDTLSYGWANPNSLAGYLRFGWKVLKISHVKILFNVKRFLEAEPDIIDEKYAGWYLVFRKNRIFRIKKNGRYFLALKTRYPFVYQIIGCAEESAAMLFEPKKALCLLYTVTPTVTDSTNQGNVVVARYSGEHIPLWKCDAI